MPAAVFIFIVKVLDPAVKEVNIIAILCLVWLVPTVNKAVLSLSDIVVAPLTATATLFLLLPLLNNSVANKTKAFVPVVKVTLRTGSVSV